MKLINIAFDLDGVLVDIMGVVKDILKAKYDVEMILTDKWEVDTDPYLSHELITKSIYIAYEYISEIKIYPGAQELLQKLFYLSGCNDPIRIVTARPISAVDDTYRLLDKRFSGFPYELIIAPGRTKFLYLNRYKYMVEDRRRTAKHLAELNKEVFLLDRCYNKMAPMSAVTRIGSIKDLIPLAHEFIEELPG